MAFEPKKYKDIVQDMQSLAAENARLTDFEVGSVTQSLLESFSYEMALLYEKMNLVYLSAFVDSAIGGQLDRVVAVLGLNRGLPDFSVGTVSFERDQGGEDISIPLGTLVSTIDTPEHPKIVYQTIETKVLKAGVSTIQVKVQAIQPGVEQDADAGTVTIMPRPIPGIKSVNNESPIKLLGRKRETDEELRERAKSALIASGKGNLLSIENAILSLRRVLDVKVKERFHYAEGEIFLERTNLPDPILLKKGTLFSYEDADEIKWIYRLVEDVLFPRNKAKAKGLIQAIKKGEESEIEKGNILDFEDSSLRPPFQIEEHSSIKRGDFGIVEVLVDAIDMDEDYVVGESGSLREVILEEIEKVRSAGIFTILSEAIQIKVDAVIRIEIGENLNLNEEERSSFETTVREEINRYFQSLKLGEPLAFSQLIKTVISVEGVENLEDFRLHTIKTARASLNGNQDAAEIVQEYPFSNQKILAEDYERFRAREICVASEDKLLPIHLEFQAEGVKENQDSIQIFRENIQSFFTKLGIGEEFKITDLQSDIEEAVGKIPKAAGQPDPAFVGDLRVIPESWCRDLQVSENDAGVLVVKTSFVENPVLGAHVFLYEDKVFLSGAFRLTLVDKFTEAQRTKLYSETVIPRIQDYLDGLKSGESVQLENMAKHIESVPEVEHVAFDLADFRKKIGESGVPEIIPESEIAMGDFEKMFLEKENILLTDREEAAEVNVSKLVISLNLTEEQKERESEIRTSLTKKLSHEIKTFLSTYQSGADIIYEHFQSALEGHSEAIYTIDTFKLKVISKDGRAQEASLTQPNDFHIRSVEYPKMQEFDISDTSKFEINPPLPESE